MAQLGGHAMFIESRTTQIAHGDTATEIGEILGLTESRISQILSQAMTRLRGKMKLHRD